jgi:hypothetical protein
VLALSPHVCVLSRQGHMPNMKSRHSPLVVVGATVLLTSFGLAQNALLDNVATRWVSLALEVVRMTNQSTQAAGRIYALTAVAMYDAVNGIERERLKSVAGPARGKIRQQALVPSDGAPVLGGGRTAAAAAAAAAHAVLVAQFSADTFFALRDQLDDALAAELDALGGETPPVITGRDWGESVGNQVIALRSNDGTHVPESQCVVGTVPPCTFAIAGGPGQFPRRFTASQFRNMTPFGIQSIVPYLSSGPPALSSTEYADAFNDVKQFGSFTDTGTPEADERAAIGRHWQAETSTARETGLFLKAALNIVEDQGTVKSLSDTTRLFALVSMATADAVAVSWTNKFDYHYWRPADAIRATGANVDGNPATVEDPMWQPRAGIGNFGGTPEHTSGSATFAGAASKVLQGFYCRDDIAFSFEGETGTAARSYTSFSQAADEMGRSRILNGIHFQFSNVSGRQAGDRIGIEVVTTKLRPEGACHGIQCTCQ